MPEPIAQVQPLEKYVNKNSRLFSLLLAIAIPLSYTAPAAAMSTTCRRVVTYLENSDNITSSWYSWFIDYYVEYCGG